MEPRPLIFRHIIPEVVAGAAELPELFVCLQLLRGQTREAAAAVAANLPEALRQAPCFLDRITSLWRYEFGEKATVAGRLVSGGDITFHTLTRLIDVVTWAQERLTRAQYENYIQRLADAKKHADLLFEFAPVLRLDSSTRASYEVVGEGIGNKTIDWQLIGENGARLLLEVKFRLFDLLHHFGHLSDPEVLDGAGMPHPDHDTDLLFRSIESKLASRSPDSVLQGAWIASGLRQESRELEDSFRRLDPSKVHFAVLGGWDDTVHLLTQEGVPRDDILRLLRVRETDQLTFVRTELD